MPLAVPLGTASGSGRSHWHGGALAVLLPVAVGKLERTKHFTMYVVGCLQPEPEHAGLQVQLEVATASES
jgi:hypothetical protein